MLTKKETRIGKNYYLIKRQTEKKNPIYEIEYYSGGKSSRFKINKSLYKQLKKNKFNNDYIVNYILVVGIALFVLLIII